MSATDVLVIGAGVIGLTTAVHLAEAGHQITVVADEIPGRTSLAAGASWGPYHVAPHDKVQGWSATTLSALTGLAQQRGTGVNMVSGVEASRTAATVPDWAMLLPDIKRCDRSKVPAEFRVAWQYTVPLVDMPHYLSYLIDRLHAAGGRLKHSRLARLTDATRTSPVVVNCSGLGARELTPDDSLHAIRGQLVVVENPGINRFFSEDTGESEQLTHYLPQGANLLLGGTAERNVINYLPDHNQAMSILKRCAEIEPLLLGVKVLGYRVGHRPTRPEVRVEVEQVGNAHVIHNYGHGGAGVSLSWGCAATTASLIEEVAG